MWCDNHVTGYSERRSDVSHQRAKAQAHRPPGSVGVRQVAREAGVSTATVSRALNTPERVTAEMRARVLEAARRLNYIPDPAARALSSQRSNRIGALIPTIDNSIFARFVEALQKQLRAAGYGLFIASHEFDPRLEVEETQRLLEGGIDGLILTGERRDPSLYDLLSARGLPYVLTSIYLPDGPHPCVGYDNRAGSAALARYLTDLGHREIGMIQGPTAVNDRALLRAQGVRDVLEGRGIALPPERVVERPFSIAQSRVALRHLLTASPEITAVICGNDVLAIGALLEAQSLGMDVPARLSIVGFDGLELAAQMSPSITTIDVPTGLMGRSAGEYLLAILRGDFILHKTLIETSLVVRGSSGPPPG